MAAVLTGSSSHFTTLSYFQYRITQELAHPVQNRLRLYRNARVREVSDGARSAEHTEHKRADDVLVRDECDERHLTRRR